MFSRLRGIMNGNGKNQTSRQKLKYPLFTIKRGTWSPPSDPPSGRACVLAGLQELQGCISLYGLVPIWNCSSCLNKFCLALSTNKLKSKHRLNARNWFHVWKQFISMRICNARIISWGSGTLKDLFGIPPRFLVARSYSKSISTLHFQYLILAH